jgi:hypothetical protein
MNEYGTLVDEAVEKTEDKVPGPLW